ncbi:unnamed protein product [Coffea canephora]|uniref:PB1 domain-containing protein n=1 Tax=Coffea canephora TaxID=49390 RepID=A0A068V4U1_COFCA|nr:unnamed protein product [Coffea canephora]
MGDKTYLTTCDQPFALQCYCDRDVKKLCEYRKHCLEYLIPVDDEELIIGPPGRVFRSGLPEYAPYVRHYTIGEYPQRDYAVGRVAGYSALPIYHPTRHLSSGVLEFASPSNIYVPLDRIPKELQNLLSTVNLTTTCRSLAQVSSCQDGEIARIEEVLDEVIEVCELDDDDDTETWTTSGEILSSHRGVDFIRKGQGVVGRAFSSKSACFCRDIRQLSITEYPLVAQARSWKNYACFAVCLRSSCLNNCIYVLEFLLHKNQIDHGDPRTLLNSIMETLKERLGSSFKIASGQELGQKLTVEVIKVSLEDEFDSFEIYNTTGVESTPRLRENNGIVESPHRQELPQNIENTAHDEGNTEINVANPERGGASMEQSGNEVNNVKKQKPICTLRSELGITREVLEQNSSRNLEDAAKAFGVSRSTLKRICREYGINRWPPRKAKKFNQAFVEQRVVQPSTENTKEQHRPDTTRLGDDSSIWVKAEYQGYTMKFRLPFSAHKFNLEEKVAQRLNLPIGSFKIEYQDEENEWIWIACDEDLSTCMSTLSSPGRTTIRMLVR